MELVKNSSSEISIRGNIKTVDDYLAIKKMANAMIADGTRQLSINILDSIVMTSSVIGYLVKLIHSDKIKVTVQISDHRLLGLLTELDLVELFNVRYTGAKTPAA